MINFTNEPFIRQPLRVAYQLPLHHSFKRFGSKIIRALEKETPALAIAASKTSPVSTPRLLFIFGFKRCTISSI